MSTALSRRIRPLLVIAVLGAGALLAPALAAATPGAPGSQPSISDVQQQLGQLALKNAQLVELYDQAQNDVQARQAAAASAQRLAVAADKSFEQARVQLAAAAAAMYEGGSFSATGALLTSSSGQGYLDQLETLSMVSAHTAGIVSNLQASKKALDAARADAAALLKTAEQRRDALMQRKDQVQQQIDKYTALLDTLNAGQRAAYQQQINPAVSSATVASFKVPPAPSKSAAQAVKFALVQVGKPYVFGAAGPDSYDCSGLTMAAWASAGVSLPHSAADQYNYGTHIAFSQLQPGDLMFFYSPIGHVTIYIGSGYMVSAPQTGENVSVIPATVFGSDFVGATRITG